MITSAAVTLCQSLSCLSSVFYSDVLLILFCSSFFFQAEDGIRDRDVTGVQTCALPISAFDGRIKPEIVALGEDGSSGAAAIVSGIALLIRDAF